MRWPLVYTGVWSLRPVRDSLCCMGLLGVMGPCFRPQLLAWRLGAASRLACGALRARTRLCAVWQAVTGVCLCAVVLLLLLLLPWQPAAWGLFCFCAPLSCAKIEWRGTQCGTASNTCMYSRPKRATRSRNPEVFLRAFCAGRAHGHGRHFTRSDSRPSCSYNTDWFFYRKSCHMRAASASLPSTPLRRNDRNGSGCCRRVASDEFAFSPVSCTRARHNLIGEDSCRPQPTFRLVWSSGHSRIPDEVAPVRALLSPEEDEEEDHHCDDEVLDVTDACSAW